MATNFDKDKREPKSVKSSSLLKYRAPLDPLEQTDGFNAEERSGTVGSTRGVAKRPQLFAPVIYLTGNLAELRIQDFDQLAQISITGTPFSGTGGGVFEHATQTIRFEVSGSGEGIGPRYALMSSGDGTTGYFGLKDDDAGGYNLVGNVTIASAWSPTTTNTHDLGTTSLRWQDIYLVNSPDVSSDRRYKSDIEDLLHGMESIRALRPVSFKRDGSSRVYLGLIAQEVKEVIPEVVTGSEEGGYGMSYEQLIPVLINAVKDLEARVDELEAFLNH